MTDFLKAEKALVRGQILKKRDALSGDDISARSRAVQERFFALNCFIKARTVLFYVSFRSEVFTHAMIKEAMSMGKTVAVPLTDIARRRMQACRINSFDELLPGAWGIPEPKPDKNRVVPVENLEVLVAPGVAFCEKGWRLGYGGGFFDRFVSGFNGSAIGLAFDLQVLKTVPHDASRDMKVDRIVTEKRVVSCRV